MLAMSMSSRDDDAAQPDGATGDAGQSDATDESGDSSATLLGWAVDGTEPDSDAAVPSPCPDDELGHDEQVIDLRNGSPFLTAMAGNVRNGTSGVGSSLSVTGFDWSNPVPLGDQWQPDGDVATGEAVHGQVTEVVDPASVPSPQVDTPPESPDDDIPPLVFLNTRGDILPSVRSTESSEEAPVRVMVDWGEDTAGPDRRVAEEADQSAVAGETSVRPTGIDQEELRQAIEETGRLFDQYSGSVIAVIASVASERIAIDEALHQTFVNAWESTGSFDPTEPRGPWMFTLARRMAFEQVASTREAAVEIDGNGYPQPSHREQEVTVDKSWEAWEVRLAVDQLPDVEYDVVRMIHRDGLIHPEIASELGSTVGAVKSRAYSGSRRLIELLDHVIRPEAEAILDEEQASALTWYLAGVADGSDLDGEERAAVKRVRSQLSSSTAWIRPDGEARDRLLDFVELTLHQRSAEHVPADNTALPPPAPAPAQYPVEPENLASAATAAVETEGPIGRTTAPIAPEVQPSGGAGVAVPATGDVPAAGPIVRPVDPSARRNAEDIQPVSGGEASPPYRPIIAGLVLLLVLVAVMTNVFGLLDGSSDGARTYQLEPTAADTDAWAVVDLAPTDTGTRFEFEFGGLDPSPDGHYYAVWLQRTVDGASVPLGSFEWETSGETIVLSGPGGHDDYDVVLVTLTARNAQAAVADPVILSTAVD